MRNPKGQNLIENLTAPVAGVAATGSVLPAPFWPQNDHYPRGTGSFLECSVHPLHIHFIPNYFKPMKGLFKLALHCQKKKVGDKMHQMEEYWAVEGVGMETSRHECIPRKDALACFVSGKGQWEVMVAADDSPLSPGVCHSTEEIWVECLQHRKVFKRNLRPRSWLV